MVSKVSKKVSKKVWTHWELNPTPLANQVLSERDNQLHHVPVHKSEIDFRVQLGRRVTLPLRTMV